MFITFLFLLTSACCFILSSYDFCFTVFLSVVTYSNGFYHVRKINFIIKVSSLFPDSVKPQNSEESDSDSSEQGDDSRHSLYSLRGKYNSRRSPEGLMAGVAIGAIAGVLVLTTLVSFQKQIIPSE